MGRLTTHVLDTAAGTPGAGMSITLHKIVDNRRETLKKLTTNHDGRCDQPLLEGADLVAGEARRPAAGLSGPRSTAASARPVGAVAATGDQLGDREPEAPISRGDAG